MTTALGSAARSARLTTWMLLCAMGLLWLLGRHLTSEFNICSVILYQCRYFSIQIKCVNVDFRIKNEKKTLLKGDLQVQLAVLTSLATHVGTGPEKYRDFKKCKKLPLLTVK